jgi:sugar lactone lactonase YvrE
LSYQWRFKGTNLVGETNTTLTLSNVQTNRAGNYDVRVTNVFGSVLSSNAVLTLSVPPGIQAQPTNQIVLVNSMATLKVTATGSPLNYQWSLNGTNLEGATNALLTIMNVNTNHAGSYVVVITNLSGSVTSRMATLTLVFSPSITVQPANQVVLSGSNVTLSVTVTGTGPFYYQWYLNGAGCFPYPIVAGTGVQGYSGDNGPATNAMLSQPHGLAIDAVGNVYIADYLNNRIRKVDTHGIITTVAGNGDGNFFGDGGPATNASLSMPGFVTVDPAGNLYIADSANNRIRKVDTNGIITSVAGNGSQGFSGDGGPATAATLVDPHGVALDSFGNLYIVDSENSRVRKVDTNGIINTVAGNGTWSYSGDGGPATNASLARPFGAAVDMAGNLYIADHINNRIRKVDTNGIITTVAGNGTLGLPVNGCVATNTSLAFPISVAVDAVGNLYIAGYTNYCILRVDTNGIITGVPTGIHSVGYVAVDAAGNLYYDDTMVNQTLLKTFMGPTLTLTNVDPSDAGNYFVYINTPYGYAISSNAVLSVYATAAATLGGYSFSADNGFQFQISGVPGFNYAVQTSTNLMDWVPLLTNSSPFIFTDASATNCPQQFYRTIYVP